MPVTRHDGVVLPDSARIQCTNDDGTVLCYDGKTRTRAQVAAEHAKATKKKGAA